MPLSRSVHGSGRYVKLASAGAAVFLSLAAPGLARAETVPGTLGARDSALSVQADGTAEGAYVDAADRVDVATRANAGGWQSEPVSVETGTLLGFEAGRLLVESNDSTRLWLAQRRATGGWQAIPIATAPKGALLGLAGLAVSGPTAAVAYTVLMPDQKSTLKLT